MSLNDFEYVSEDPIPKDLSFFSLNIGGAISKRDAAYRAIDAVMDSAGVAWFELGQKLERGRVLELLDNFEDSLVDSEEDAKMAIHVLREMILSAQEETEEKTGDAE